ncbi:recombination mediator RecR [uncultured Brevibacterium sp.]|uniref:recombination mediator RecR n=1 Tax=uncultured Brevibacterium sp. TaxID=189678 RepID=UPI0025DB2307|nr:recombination mediator RecR [uncultured Brevibacterium sp.]
MYDGALADLVDELGKLPGIGPKSAQRLAFHILQSPAQQVEKLASALTEVKRRVNFCEICGNVAEGEKCAICQDSRRDQSVICVVEEAKDVVAIERTREYRGLYHVLGGAIDPMAGIGPDQLRIKQLLTRLQTGAVRECVIATDPNLEGEATATYVIRLLSTVGVNVSKLASGLPVGGDLEYADEVTLGRAFQGRTQVHTGE